MRSLGGHREEERKGEREREGQRGRVSSDERRRGREEYCSQMARCFFPSSAWPGDGDREASLPSDQHREPFVLPWPPGSSAVDRASGFYGPSPSSSSSSSVAFGGSAVAKAVAASKVHSMAERRRRERINGHLSTLRRMIPNADKMDKASLLWSVIQEVRVLKRKALDIGKRFAVPAEVNQVSVECDEGGTEPAGITTPCPLIRASICCDDRPDLFADIMEALRYLRLRAVRADMASLGGRVRHAFVLRRASAGEDDVCLSSLVESTRDVLGKVASMEEEAAPSGLSTKRRRLLHSRFFSHVPY